MHYFLYPTKDAYISNLPAYMYKNTGLDELLEVEKRISTNGCSSVVQYTELVGYTASSCELLSGSFSGSFNPESTSSVVISSSYEPRYTNTISSVVSRALLRFDLDDVATAITNNEIINPKFYLNLKICESVEVPTKYTLFAYPISQSWDMGTGYKYDGSTSPDGVNWKFSSADQIKKWWSTGSFTDCSGGGVWWIDSNTKKSGSAIDTHIYISGSYSAKQDFDYQTSDVKMEVTSMVLGWLNEEIENNGLILMHSDESSSVEYGTLKFFSKETNTIYSPYLDVAWDDSVLSWASPGFDTGSASPIQIRDAVVGIKNMATEYKFGSIIRLDVSPRKRYPQKTFTNKLSDYLSQYYLPSSSFYQIKDAESEENILPYDDFTRLSFDSNGNYFMLDTTGLPSERYYKVQIRTEQSGSIMTFDIPTPFKISR